MLRKQFTGLELQVLELHKFKTPDSAPDLKVHGSYLAKVKHLGSPVTKCDPSAPQLFFACTLGTQVVHLPEKESAFYWCGCG